jgi:hypothetical protein
MKLYIKAKRNATQNADGRLPSSSRRAYPVRPDIESRYLPKGRLAQQSRPFPENQEREKKALQIGRKALNRWGNPKVLLAFYP